VRTLKFAGVLLVAGLATGGSVAAMGAPAVAVARSTVTVKRPTLPAPDGLGAVPGDGTVTLSWAAVAGATTYRVLRGGEPVATVAEAGWRDPAATNGVDVTYRVVAVDVAGIASPPSNEATVRPLPPAPAAPRAPKATAADSRVALSWPAAAAGYVVTRNGREVATVTTPAWTDAAVVNGQTYDYAVRAVDSFGQRSALSDGVTAKPLPPAPVAPTGLVAVESSGTVTFSWNVVSTATTYTVLRDNVVIDTVDTARYTDTAVEAAHRYTYRVRAHGEFGLTSPLSAAASVTLAAPKPQVAGPVTLISAGDAAQPGASLNPFVSADGRYVAFTSYTDVLVYDRTTKATTREAGPGAAVGISADGRYVAFTANRALFVRDRALGTTSPVPTTPTAPVGDDPVSPVGGGASPATGPVNDSPVLAATMSADGRFLAFTATGDGSAADVFVHDRTTGVTARVATAGAQRAGLAISADGRFVAFVSDATDLVADDTNDAPDVFVHDRGSGITQRVSVATGGAQADGSSGHRPGLSADGRWVSFTSDATDLVTGDTNARPDVFVHDRTTGSTIRVTASSGTDHEAESMSADGRFVTYRAMMAGRPEEIFVFDRLAGTTRTLVRGAASSISADGRYVAFHSSADLLPEKAAGQQVYLVTL
jgi:Tol biopolymer transport system component/fibronectin type 3 domain-containing protein